MKLDIFQSHKGDCLLLESKDGHRILCDGGMSAAMSQFVAPALAKLRKANKKIDVAYISHIDQDHISGVLRLLRDEVDWRVFEYQRSKGNPKARKPKNPRPPVIGGIWHNSFRGLQDDHDGAIEDLIASTVPALLATGVSELRDMGERLYDIATSIPEALEVSGLAGAGLLGIPVNRLPGSPGPARLLMSRPGQGAVKIGSLRLTIIGPGEEELRLLRKGWDNWLVENGRRVEEINDEVKRRMEEIGARAAAGPILNLSGWNGIPDYEGVTVPNIASLMFMVEEDGKRVLLTGDSQQDVIIRGLTAAGFLGPQGLHVEVLKIQHHGSENNLDEAFARQVSADHYVFCGNGEHENPDLGVIRKVFASRLGAAGKRAIAPRADGRAFTMWFSATAAVGPNGEKGRKHMVAVEKLVKDMVATSNGRMKVWASTKPFVTLRV
ncbi:MAG: MBL fold metallo-hydrolase [Candidatus Rokuibacteriota bacterium]